MYPSSGPTGIIAGPDGNLWIAEGYGKIARIQPYPAGSPGFGGNEYTVPTASSGPLWIAVGPDGNLWFTEMAYGYNVGRITTAGNITEFNVGYSTYGIVAGSDGNVWFTSATFVGRITPAGSITTYAIPTQYSDPGKMTLGLDQNVWFVENLGKVGRVTMTGNITEFSPSSGADGIATGSDGNLWFTEGDANKIGRITTSGSITEFDLPVAGSFPYDIAAGPDGNLWFTESNRNVLGRITP